MEHPAARYIRLVFSFFKIANSQKIVQISISCLKKTYELVEYLRLDNVSHQKFRTNMMYTKSNFWIQSNCFSLSRYICLYSSRYIYLAGDIYLQLEIYISCWIYTSSLWFLQNTNIQKIVQISISCLKKTYELNEYLQLDNLSYQKFRTKICLQNQIFGYNLNVYLQLEIDIVFLDTMSISSRISSKPHSGPSGPLGQDY